MSVQCAAPDPGLGVAMRIAAYLNCQSHALGENGFQALTGGPVMTTLLSGLVTIFVALIGYRMILGYVPGIRDGIGWTVRLGLVLALATSWPAFQTLVYRVVADGPEQLAATLLPATGLSPVNMDERIQNAYDEIRLGSSSLPGDQAGAQTQKQTGPAAAPATGLLPRQEIPGLAPLPQTASIFVVSTGGMIGAMRLVVGLLVAIGPLAILCLLFAGTRGIFEGWVRAVSGAALGVLAANVTAGIELMIVESEIAHAQAVKLGVDAADTFDPQALFTIIALFIVVAIAAVITAARVASAFRLPAIGEASWLLRSRPITIRTAPLTERVANERAEGSPGKIDRPSRTTAVADALVSASLRDQAIFGDRANMERPARLMTIRQEGVATSGASVVPVGVAGQRMARRRTQSAQRRNTRA